MSDVNLSSLANGIPLPPPEMPAWDSSVPHAPKRVPLLTVEEKKIALKNALRYFPSEYHKQLAPEFLEELEQYGHIYMYRFRPTSYAMKAHPIECYPAKTYEGKCIQLMIQNNLDPNVAQFPQELVTYGGNGCVFSNWAQYHISMRYLSELTKEQTLVMYSGHPHGLFPSHPGAPRLVITNGMIVPSFSEKALFEKMFAMGNTMYGQMTAGSYCYIGPQGIVHGTTITIMNAGRKYLGLEDLSGKVFVTSGLGGMSGAQPKAGKIVGCVSVTAEVDERAAKKRLAQGWLDVLSSDLEEIVTLIKKHRESKVAIAIGYVGNVVDLWDRLAKEETNIVELGSDQTSCHNPYGGGYYPAGMTLEESNKMMYADPEEFKNRVQASLRRQVDAINTLVGKGMRFWDYGNSFLLEAGRAKANIFKANSDEFKYPSYVQDIMGDIFSLGFGPFRWVCTSGKEADLALTDEIAAEVIQSISPDSTSKSQEQFRDNLKWIQEAGRHKLVVGSQARILYMDHVGRIRLAQAFNDLVASGRVSGPIVMSRDHHDVSSVDSPYRETSNIYDGSNKTADMAVQNFVGDAVRGATWVALHNGGGTGWGMAINGGFGMVLDGSEDARTKATRFLLWDVLNGVSRRYWSENSNAKLVIDKIVKEEAYPDLVITTPQFCDDEVLKIVL